MNRENRTLRFDVVILGGGLAGLSAAIKAKQSFPRLEVAVVTAGRLGYAGCGYETHGINAAFAPNDSWEQHYQDTLKSGMWINNKNLAMTLCQEIPKAIEELMSWGIPFQRDESDCFVTGEYGGSSEGRSLHYYDLTGLVIMQAMTTRSILAGIHVLENQWILDLLVEGDYCFGAVVYDRQVNRIYSIEGSSVVSALGGGACVYPVSSISADKCGTGIILGYKHGIPVLDMEMVQFHPTGLRGKHARKKGVLLEEEMRKMGGVLENSTGERFMPRYDSRAEMATRDVVSRASFMEISAGRGTEDEGVIFDLSAIKADELAARFPNTIRRIRDAGIDLRTTRRIEVSPTAHFLMGGLLIDQNCKTRLSGLFACGEDAGGIHGANRLGGNGVADALVFGRIAGFAAGEYADSSVTNRKMRAYDVGIASYALDRVSMERLSDSIRQTMWTQVGLVREERGLRAAVCDLANIRERLDKKTIYITLGDGQIEDNVINGMNLYNALILAELIASSSLIRRDSAGAHFRNDYPDSPSEPYNLIISRDERGRPKINIQEIAGDSQPKCVILQS